MLTSSVVTSDIWAEDSSILLSRLDGKRKPKGVLVFNGDRDKFRHALLSLNQATIRPQVLSSQRWSPIDVRKAVLLGKAFAGGHYQVILGSAKKEGWVVHETPLALEGGNVLSMNNKNGQPMAIVGLNTLLANWLMFKRSNQIDAVSVATALRSGVDEEVVKLFKQLYSRKNLLKDSDARKMAAEVEVIKNMIARTFNLPANEVLYVAQENFHIDMSMRPIGKGKIMVSDPKKSLAVVEKSLTKLGAFPRTPDMTKEIYYLESLVDSLKKLTYQQEESQTDISFSQLKKRDLTVIGAPLFGFRGYEEANFANAISAIDTKGQTYLITNRSESKTLDKTFAEYMKSELNIEVEWVSTTDILERGNGGIDCLTLQSRVPGTNQSVLHLQGYGTATLQAS